MRVQKAREEDIARENGGREQYRVFHFLQPRASLSYLSLLRAPARNILFLIA